ncbi:DUF4136 domain-containing protein [Haloferula sp. A504]|uniref:DUF4136 domain-containing protein n=1 Tax=Haloferula sp. A504 TaxID=3373601 RepID=UPI0031C0D794|nr:DUF4136 domain-containing protein [Verrucomicrobiaceae bacterium E54]
MHRSLLLPLVALALSACSGKIDMPRGTGEGYSSARLIQRSPNSTISDATERKVHGMIQNSLKKQFTANGKSWGSGSADLIVAYMVIYQEPAMTASYDDYFGYGRDGTQISERAHDVGVLESKRPDYFRSAAIVVDVIDARTNELIYRNYAQGDVVSGVSDGARAGRIDAAVAQALGEFFKG